VDVVVLGHLENELTFPSSFDGPRFPYGGKTTLQGRHQIPTPGTSSRRSARTCRMTDPRTRTHERLLARASCHPTRWRGMAAPADTAALAVAAHATQPQFAALLVTVCCLDVVSHAPNGAACGDALLGAEIMDILPSRQA
jgi:hypothetical protein